MCYAIPAKVIDIKGRFAIVDYFGEKRKVVRDLLSFSVGDYVYVQAGMAIRKIPKNQAEELLRIWKGLFVKLKEQDEKIVNADYANKGLSTSFNNILDKLNSHKRLDRQDYLELLSLQGSSDMEAFFNTANKLRNINLSNSCCIHGIIELSNFCKNNCLYCGIRRDNEKIKRYRMSMEEIDKAVDYAVNKRGFKVLVLQSGEDDFYTKEKIIEIIRLVRKKYQVLIFISLGERDAGDYQAFYAAGARGALLRFETSNPKIYSRMRPGKKLEDRVNLIKALRKIGYLVATGFLLGLPKESDKDILNNILLTKRLKPEMYSFGPLITHPDTPLANLRKLTLEKILKVVALARFIDRKSRLLVTTALETIDEDAKEKALLSGANSLMINATPDKYRKLYDIYPSRAGCNVTIEEQIARNLKLLYRLGRAPTDLGA